eukprot:6125878-Prymnesium_polylepis.1
MCGAGGAGESAPAGRSYVQCGPCRVPCVSALLRNLSWRSPYSDCQRLVDCITNALLVTGTGIAKSVPPDTMLPALTRRDAVTARGSHAAEALSISLKKSRSLVRLYLHNRRGDKNSSICGPKGWTALASAAEAIPSLTEADLGRNYLDAQVLKLNLDERGTPQQTTAQDAC